MNVKLSHDIQEILKSEYLYKKCDISLNMDLVDTYKLHGRESEAAAIEKNQQNCINNNQGNFLLKPDEREQVNQVAENMINSYCNCNN